MELKTIIENPKSKFKIIKITFKPKIKNLIGFSYRYFLKYNNKFIYLGLKRDIENTFRNILNSVYGGVENSPNNFFKKYLITEYNKQTKITKKIEKLKKPYYTKQRIQSKKEKIKRLKLEIEKEKENLNKLNSDRNFNR